MRRECPCVESVVILKEDNKEETIYYFLLVESDWEEDRRPRVRREYEEGFKQSIFYYSVSMNWV